MGVRLLPLNVSELCSHALELERDCEQRFFDYSRHMHEIGAHGVANVFEELGQESINQIRALEVASGERRPAELSPWEYAWRLTYMPEGMEQKPRLVPLNAREALQLSVLAKRRAQDFFNDVAQNARDLVVRSCAAEMAAGEQSQLKRLEKLLATEIRASAGMAQAEVDEAANDHNRMKS